MKYLFYFLSLFSHIYILANPDWMMLSLYEDFSHANFTDLKTRINSIQKRFPDIPNTFGIVQVVVKNHKAKFYWPKEGEDNKAVRKPMEKSIQNICENFALKDFTFFFFMHDQYHHKNGFEKFQIPVLVFTKHKGANDEIAIPDWTALGGYDDVTKDQNPDEFINQLASKFPFNKRIKKALWRGGCSGHLGPTENWAQSERGHLVYESTNKKSYLLDIKYSEFKSRYPTLDKSMDKSPFVAGKKSLEDHFKYRYLIDIDGWGATYSRLWWILGSGSLCLKLTSNLEQWYYRGLIDNIHYISISKDINEIEAKIEYFNQNPKTAEELANNAKIFWKKYLSQRNQRRYFLYVLRYYSELFNDIDYLDSKKNL